MPDTSSSPSSELHFEKDDAFGWSGFASKLEAFLLTETEFVEGSLVVSLNAPFGSGKTTFLRMWKSQLEIRRESGAEAPMCVVINAWEDDYCGDPLFSLVDAIEKETRARVANEDIERQIASLKEATKDISWFMLAMAGNFVSHWTGFDPAAAGELAEKKKRANRGADQSSADLFTMFKRRKEALQRLKKALRSLFAGKMHPVFVIVDELDRCRPDFAIQYLETIKHVFDIHGLVFVLAVDVQQLENSARALFGDHLNFPEYYRKFAHRNIHLPLPDAAGIRNLVTKYIDRYLDNQTSEAHQRKTLLNFENTHRALTELPHELGLTPRQIQEAFRIIGHLTSGKEKSGTLYYHIANAAIFLVFVSLWKPAQFLELESAQVSLDRLLEIIAHLPASKKNREWWSFVLTMSLNSSDEAENIEALHGAFMTHGVVSKKTTVEEFRQILRRYTPNAIGNWSSLTELARRIRELDRFAE